MIRSRFPRERGIYAFRTPPSDYLDLASGYRTKMEQGRCDMVAGSAMSDATMVSAQGSFDWEWYQRWSREFYGSNNGASFWGRRDIARDYIPIRWSSYGMSDYEVRSSMEHIVSQSGYAAPPDDCFDLRWVACDYDFPPSCEHPPKRYVLYAKKSWLRTFKVGLDLINYFRMAVNFKQVYGFG